MATIKIEVEIDDIEFGDSEKEEIAYLHLRSQRSALQIELIQRALSTGELQQLVNALASNNIVADGYVEAS